MKKTYPTSTKAQQWAQHLKPFGKRQANKSTRKINKEIAKQDDDTLTVKSAPSQKKKQKFAIEFHNGNGRWKIWRKYVTEGRRDKSLENLIKRYGNSTFGFMNRYQFRIK